MQSARKHFTKIPPLNSLSLIFLYEKTKYTRHHTRPTLYYLLLYDGSPHICYKSRKIMVILLIQCLILFALCFADLSFKTNPHSATLVWEIEDRWFQVQNMINHTSLVEQETKIDSTRLPEMFDVDPFFLSLDAVRKFTRNMSHPGATQDQLQNHIARRKFLKSYLFPKYVLAHRQLAVFRNSTIDLDGIIYDPHVRKFAANGGCHNRFSEPKLPGSRVPYFDNVISLTAVWTHKPWHLAMESSTALAHVDPALISKSHIHVLEINDFTVSWLSLLGIDKNKLIAGTIKANNLYIPEMGRCGGPSQLQLKWLREKLLPSPNTIKPTHLILIKRASRGLPRYDEVLANMEAMATLTGYPLVIHDDEVALPTMQEQVVRFANAVAVVAPHGAGELFNAFLHSDACVIEYNNQEKNPVYGRLAMMLNTSYVMLHRAAMDMSILTQWLKRCPLIRHTLMTQGKIGEVSLDSLPPFRAGKAQPIKAAAKAGSVPNNIENKRPKHRSQAYSNTRLLQPHW